MAEILEEAVQNKLTNKKMTEIIQRKAFLESTIPILDALKSEEWPFITKNFKTPVQNVPSQPLTILQKRWMKALLSDKRIHLFEPDGIGLEDVEPLYDSSVFVYFDQFTDGDPYEDESYIKNFRTMLTALKSGNGLFVKFTGRMGMEHEIIGVLQNIEYSAKDDKFRLKVVDAKSLYAGITEINMARVKECKIVDMESTLLSDLGDIRREKKRVVLELQDERDSLRRAMLHFSYLEKETTQLDEKNYRIIIHYEKNDENELLIQILSFGPLIKVTAPVEFQSKIRERIQKQKRCSLCKKSS